jgi:ankyrin repeat protein
MYTYGKNGESELHIAVFKNNLRAAKLLLKQGGAANCLDSCRTTPMHVAAVRGNLTMVLLLEPHYRTLPSNLVWSCVQGNDGDVFEELYAKGMEIGPKSWRMLGVFITPLHIAATNQDINEDIFNRLWDTCAHTQNFRGETPVLIAELRSNHRFLELAIAHSPDMPHI